MDNNLLYKLVGLTKKDQPVAAYLASLNSPPQTKRFEEDGGYYESYPELGMSFVFEEPHEVLTGIFLYAGGVDGFEEYKGSLPEALRFAYTRQDVLQRLGEPTKSGGNKYTDLLRQIVPFWSSYNMEGYILHITYGAAWNRISMITLMPLPKD